MESFCLSKVQRHSNDQVSEKTWSEEWKNTESNPDLFYKFQGEELPVDIDLLKEDVAMVRQTPFQKAMAQKFSHNGICLDSTHGTTQYDLLLTSLLVLDEFGQGIPVVWLLSNHEDVTNMCLLQNH